MCCRGRTCGRPRGALRRGLFVIRAPLWRLEKPSVLLRFSARLISFADPITFPQTRFVQRVTVLRLASTLLDWRPVHRPTRGANHREGVGSGWPRHPLFRQKCYRGTEYVPRRQACRPAPSRRTLCRVRNTVRGRSCCANIALPLWDSSPPPLPFRRGRLQARRPLHRQRYPPGGRQRASSRASSDPT